MARAVLLAVLLGLWSPQAMAETVPKAVSVPTFSLSAGVLPALTQPLSSSAPSKAPATAVVPGVPDRSVRDATGRNLSDPHWPEVRNTGRIAPPDIFTPPKT